MFEQSGGVQMLEMRDRGAIIVPRGIWHTAQVFAPSRMLHLTMGAGTQHKPVLQSIHRVRSLFAWHHKHLRASGTENPVR